MPIKNVKQLLIEATTLPAAIEAKLPAGAPKVSTMLLDAANQAPAVPDFPIEVPDLPAPPALPDIPIPTMPGTPTGAAMAAPYVTGLTTRLNTLSPPVPTPVTPLVQAYTQPIEGVLGTVRTTRGM